MNFWIKFVVFSLLLRIFDQLFDSVRYAKWEVILLTSLTLTLVGITADKLIVPIFGNLASTLMGYVGITIIIWGIAWLAPGSHVPFKVALLMAVPAAMLEYILHRFVSPRIRY